MELTALGQANEPADLHLLGAHQQTNARLAKAVVNRLQPVLPVTPAQLEAGLAKVHWPGRLRIVETGDQTFLLDGAHNAEGAAILRAALTSHFPGRSPAFILGMVDEKDGNGFCRELAPLAKRLVLAPVRSGRSANPTAFLPACREANATIADSLGQALEQCSDEPFVVVTGSFYLVGEAMERLGVSPTPTESERLLNDWGTPGALGNAAGKG